MRLLVRVVVFKLILLLRRLNDNYYVKALYYSLCQKNVVFYDCFSKIKLFFFDLLKFVELFFVIYM